MHYENTKAALLAGKHVLCEKVSRTPSTFLHCRLHHDDSLLIPTFLRVDSFFQPFTFDLTELDELIKIAKEKNLFLMEAVWTRFVSGENRSRVTTNSKFLLLYPSQHPIAYKLQELVFSGKYGKVKRM